MLKYCDCLDCNNRHVGCHSNCKSYKAFKERLAKIREAKQQAQLVATHTRRKR